MDYRDYYQTLGVPRDADDKTIRRAYHKLAKRYHPDHNPGDKAAETRFKEVTEAYEVLGDPEKRAKFDRFGHAWNRHQQSGSPGGFDWSAWGASPGQGRTRTMTPDEMEGLFGGSGGGFSDFFRVLFGEDGFGGAGDVRGAGGGRGARRERVAARGQDIEQPVTVSLYEAYHGADRVVAKDGRRLEIRIPPGVRSGSKVRLRGEGAPGPGGASGDLLLVVQVAPDPRFERIDDDLVVTLPIPVATAVLGGEARVPTLSGDVTLTIPPETQNGRRFRLRGRGMPRLKDPERHGDLFAVADIRLPTGLSAEERALFEQLRELRPAG